MNLALQYRDAFFLLEDGRLAAEVDRPEEISQEIIERVFRVRAHRIQDPANGQTVWRFEL